MPSGKKARGRKNRAKKEATLAARQRTLWEPTILLSLRDKDDVDAASSCEHMLAVLPRIPQFGTAVSFMNCLAGEGFFDKVACFPGDPIVLCIQPLLRFPRVQKEASERSLAIDLLLRFIRNTFLSDSVVEGEKWFQGYRTYEGAICVMVYMLELCGKYSDEFVARRRANKTSIRLTGGNRRDVVKFVAKRLPCTCLKELHSATRKKVAKVGTCYGCRKQFPRSQLYVCTGCMIIEYCSPACQRADWSRHKRHCGNPEVMRQDLPADCD